MADDNIFDIDDTALYTSWEPRNDGIVIIHIPGIGEIKMTIEKAEEISADLARQAEYGRWAAIEKEHDKETRSEPQKWIYRSSRVSQNRFWWNL